jgi:beta-galactosidase
MRNILKLTAIFLFISGASLIAQTSKHIFLLSDSGFLLDGQPFQIISGELHPARIPAVFLIQCQGLMLPHQE